MGFSISWLAFRNKKQADILSIIGLADTGEQDEANESPVSGSFLPGDWYIIFVNKFAPPLVQPKALSALSGDCQIVGCQVEEHVMACAAFYYDHGRQVWRVTHESEKGIFNLAEEGILPETFTTVRLDHERKQKEQDGIGAGKMRVDFIFEIPIVMAFELCRYRHDRARFDWGQPAFTRLAILDRKVRPHAP